MEFKVFLIALIIISIAQSKEQVFEKTKDGFPKVIWSYWDQGIEKAPIFARLCLKNRDAILKENGWKHIFLQKDTLHEYIDTAEVQRYFQMSVTEYVQVKADLIRLLLLMKYGGMWLDVNSYFLTDLSWIQNPKQPFIHNQLESPDLILSAFTEGSSGGNYTYITRKTGQTINVFPTYENWMIISKPNTEFLHDWLNVYIEICLKSRPVMDAQNAKDGILIPIGYIDYYFTVSDYTQQIIIQRKQKQLQRQNSTQFAFEYYRISHIEAHENIFKYFLFQCQQRFPMWTDISVYSTNEIQLGGPTPYFRKSVGWHHPFFTNYLNNYVTYNCWGFQSFVENGSEVSEALFRFAKGESFFRHIEEFHQNLNEKEFCRKFVDENEQTLLSQGFISLTYWIAYGSLLLLGLSILGCYHYNDYIDEKDQKYSIY